MMTTSRGLRVRDAHLTFTQCCYNIHTDICKIMVANLYVILGNFYSEEKCWFKSPLYTTIIFYIKIFRKM